MLSSIQILVLVYHLSLLINSHFLALPFRAANATGLRRHPKRGSRTVARSSVEHRAHTGRNAHKLGVKSENKRYRRLRQSADKEANEQE